MRFTAIFAARVVEWVATRSRPGDHVLAADEATQRTLITGWVQIRPDPAA